MGGNSLNYSPALIGSLNGGCTEFPPTVLFCKGALSCVEVKLASNELMLFVMTANKVVVVVSPTTTRNFPFKPYKVLI